MSKSKQPDGTVHRITPGVTPWPPVNATQIQGAFNAPSNPTPPPDQTGAADAPSAEEAMVWEGTEHDARRLRRARMLPTNVPLSAQQIDDVRSSVRKFKDEFGVSLSSLGKEIGVSSTTVSLFLSGSYSGDNEKIARGLNSAIERLAKIEESRLPTDWFPFDQALKMLRVVDDAVQYKQMGLITAPSGGCKTTTVEAAKRKHPGAVIVRVTSASKSAGGMLRSVAKVLGTRTTGTTGAILDEIVSELGGTSRPIFFDEAQQFNDAALEAVRDIHDLCKIPIVFWGTDNLALNMDNRGKWLGQLRSRIVHRFHAGASMAAASSPDAPRKKPRPMFTADELVAWFDKQGVRLTDDGRLLMFQLANIPEMGCLRFALQVVRKALQHKDYHGKNAPLDAKVLRSVAAVIHGQRFERTLEQRIETHQLTAVA